MEGNNLEVLDQDGNVVGSATWHLGAHDIYKMLNIPGFMGAQTATRDGRQVWVPVCSKKAPPAQSH